MWIVLAAMALASIRIHPPDMAAVIIREGVGLSTNPTRGSTGESVIAVKRAKATTPTVQASEC